VKHRPPSWQPLDRSWHDVTAVALAGIDNPQPRFGNAEFPENR
jgi:hypothetical protein